MFVVPLPGGTCAQDLAGRLYRRPGFVWLDGQGEGEGRYSFLGCEPTERLRARVGEPDPLALLDRLDGFEDPAPDADAPLDPACVPRFVGYLAYDACHAGRTSRLARAGDAPAAYFARYDALVAIDHLRGRAFVVGDDAAACERLGERLRAAHTEPEGRCGPVIAQDPARHEAAIACALEHIARGDLYQVNLARAFRASFSGEPFALALAMRERSPVPLGAYLDDGERAVIARTMERFVRWERRDASLWTRPIKGTLARHGDDAREAERLAGDPKERAEHTMIIDLMRNDLGQVAALGTVRVPQVMTVEPYAGLSHLVSTVRCTTAANVSLRRILAATFPPGSVTGTPKRRAIELIEALESTPRGLYTGALGFVDRTGGLSLAVTIRTAVVERGEVRYFAGGGIVEASVPEHELAETELKARVFVEAARALDPESRRDHRIGLSGPALVR